MIENWLFILAIIAVLLIPGPGNALFARSAHDQGILTTIRLMPAELLGYIYGMSLCALLIHLSMPIWPNLIHILHIASMFYVLWLAFHLWNTTQLQQYTQKQQYPKSRQIFISTLRNPKIVLLSAGVLPMQTWESAQDYATVMGIFALCLIPCTLFWIHFGRALFAAASSNISTEKLYKGSAMLLVLCMLPLLIRFF